MDGDRTDEDRATRPATFNINDYAFVRLTDEGVAQFIAHYADLTQYGFDPAESLRYALRPNGEYRFQIHEMMLIFGPACYVGSNRAPFKDNAVRFEPSL